MIDGANGVQSLEELVAEINSLGAGVTAMTINVAAVQMPTQAYVGKNGISKSPHN